MPADSLHSTPRSEHTSESSPEPKKKHRLFSLRIGNRRRRSNSHHDDEPMLSSPTSLSQSRTSFSAPRSPSFLRGASFSGADSEDSDALRTHSPPPNAIPRNDHSQIFANHSMPTQSLLSSVSHPTSPPQLPRNESNDHIHPPKRSTPLNQAEKRLSSHRRSISADLARLDHRSDPPRSLSGLQPSVSPLPEPVSSRTQNSLSRAFSMASGNGDDHSDSDSDSCVCRAEGDVVLDSKVSKESVRFSLMLNEAAADTPSFRASAKYVDVMFTDFEQWLQRFANQTGEVITKLNEVKSSVNDVISLFMPGATHSSIFAQDYTTLAFGRYTEAEQVFWTDLFVRAAKNANEVVEMVKRLRQTSFPRYRHAQSRYTESLRELEASRLDLFQLPLHAERAAEREAMHRLHKAQHRHWHVATKLVIVVSELEAECTVSLLETLSRNFMTALVSGRAASDADRVAISIEMHRLQQAAASLRQSLPKLSDELRERRRSLRQKTKDSTNLGTFNHESSQNTRFEWVRAELKPRKWQLLYAFMQNGMFGFLGLSENGTAVVESPKVVARSARFEVLDDEECRHAFRVVNIDNEPVTVQATSAQDLELWKQAFTRAADYPILSRSSSTAALTSKNGKLPLLKRNASILSQSKGQKRSSLLIDCTSPPPLPTSRQSSPEPGISVVPNRWSAMDLRPWNPSFSLDGCQSRASPDSDVVVARIDELRNDMLRARGLKFDSTLTSRGSMDFDLRIPAVMSLPTSVQLEAVVANSFFRPEYTCNAITANLWGVTGQHLRSEDPSQIPLPVARPNTFPSYPDNYASSMMVQDMDMRCMVSQLPHQFAMLPGEVMLTMVRAVQLTNDVETPVRLYFTNHRMLIYGTWCGIVSITCYPITSLMDVEASHGVDFSTLRMFVQLDCDPPLYSERASPGPENSASRDACAVATLEFKLFIDSAVLAKRKVDYIKENSRLTSPENCHDILDALAVISIEHGENQKRHELQIVKGIQEWPRAAKAVEESVETGAKLSTDPGPVGKLATTGGDPSNLDMERSFANYILASSVGTGSNRGEEDALRLSSGMNTKLGEDTYPLTVDALFLVMFGAKSPVFEGEHAGFMPSDCKPGYWYRRGRRLERRIKERYSGLGLDYENRFNVQRVDRRHADLFIVTEKRAPWQIPEGDRFYALIKYVAYATAGGCHLQVWLKIVWMDQKGNLAAEKSVEQSMGAAVKSINLKARLAAQKVHNLEEARNLYGSVKPEKVLTNKGGDRGEDPDLKATKITKRVLILMFIHTYWRMSANFRRTMRRQAWHYIKISVPKIIVLLLMLLSLLANMVLYQRYRGQYWQAELERNDVDALVKQLRLAPNQQCTFSRAIYTSDVNDMFRAGSLWGGSPSYGRYNLTQIDEPRNASSRCFQKFSEIAQLSLTESEFGNLYRFEPHVQTVLTRIADTRYEYAVKRNELMTLLNMLNHQELDDLRRVYQNWLIHESHMCSEARRALPLLEAGTSEAITAYCLSCLQEAKNLY